MTTLEYTDEERSALYHALPKPEPASDPGWKERQARFRAIDDVAFDLMKAAIQSGDISQKSADLVEWRIAAQLRRMPETLAEMLLYTREIDIFVSWHKYYTGWWWKRRACRLYMSTEFTFGPYRGSVSAWTDPKAPDGVVRFQ